MNLAEYQKVKELTYAEYCDYLQNKYGIGLCDYFTADFVKNRGVTRTKEGLIAHHKKEDVAIMLSNPDFARLKPFEYQSKENIVYCDYLEHLLLHVLICEHWVDLANKKHGKADSESIVSTLTETLGPEAPGVGGVVNFLCPELNDVYSGWVTKQGWRLACHDKIKDDKDVYLEIVRRFKKSCKDYPCYEESMLTRSFNAPFGIWDETKNAPLYEQLTAI